MRLGDLDALKERLNEIFETFHVVLFDDIIATIDNAPTVYPICEDKACKYRANEIPKSYWVDDEHGTTCHNCGDLSHRWSNFCPNCGADMQEGGTEK